MFMLFMLFMSALFLAPDGDGGGGGGPATGAPPAPPPTGDLPPPPPEDPKFTDKDMAQMRRKHERELKIRDKTIADQEVRLKALEDGPNDPPPSEPPPPPPGDKSKGELEILQKRHEREMDQARKDAAEAKKIASDERTLRRKVERDRALDSALALAGVADKAKIYAKDHFEKKVVWDDVDEAWVYKTRQGNLVDIADGVTEEMPDMFKATRISASGAGTQGGMPASKVRLSQQLTDARAEAVRLSKLDPRSNSNVIAYQNQLRLVKQLVAQSGGTT